MKVIKKIGASVMILILLLGICNIRPVEAIETQRTYLNDESLKNEAREYFKTRKHDAIIMGEIRVYKVTTKVPSGVGENYIKYQIIETYKYDIDYKYNLGVVSKELLNDYGVVFREFHYTEMKYYNTTGDTTGNSRTKEESDNSNYDNPYKDTSYDYEEEPVQGEIPAEPEKITVSATKIESKMKEGGSLYINVTFSEPIKVKKAPILKIKIGDKIREVAYNSQTNNSITYKTLINDVNDCGKSIVLESLKGGNVESKKSNTITTMDYESKLTNKNLGTVGNFILVKKDSIGDINKDLRIDNLDVEAITNCKDKNIADVNGDGKINELDKTDLKKALENRDLKYVRFLKVSEFKLCNIHGDVDDGSGKGNPDGVINYHDSEYLANHLSQISTDKGDVNGNGKVDTEDVMFINKAISSQSPIYLLYIKIDGDNYADIYTTQDEKGVINAKDVFAIADLYKENATENDKGDINKDGIVNIYDQIALSQMLYSNDISKTKYFKVFVGAKGDVNKDGIIDYYDAQKIASYITKPEDINIDTDIADVDGNGKVEIYDVSKILAALQEEEGKLDAKIALLSESYFIIANDDYVGDVNGDGVVNYYDAKLIGEYILNNDESKLDISKADVDKNGKVDLYDAINIMKQLNGLNENARGLTDEEMANKDKIDYEYVPGDVNQDGVVNVADVVAINMYLLNSEQNPLTEARVESC